MKVNQDISAVAVNLLESESGIPGPEIEGLAQFQPDPACVKTTGLLGSQAVIKKKVPRVRNRLIDPTMRRT